MPKLLFDIESDGLLDTITKVHCLVTLDIDTGEMRTFAAGDLKDGLAYLQTAAVLSGHNIFRYDLPALRKLHGFVSKADKLDTMVLSQLLWPDLADRDFTLRKTNKDFPANQIGSHSLKAWGYRLGELKGDFNETTDWKEFTPEMLAYCQQDVRVNLKLLQKAMSKGYAERAIKIEMEFAEIAQSIEENGFVFNRSAAIDLYSRLSQRRLELEREAKAIFPGWTYDMKTVEYWSLGDARYATKGEAEKAAKGIPKAQRPEIVAGPLKKRLVEFNPGSRDHMAKYLTEKYGWKPEHFTDSGKPELCEEVIEGLPYPEAKLFAEYLLVDKRVGQLAEGNQAWLKLERGGRIHGRMQTCGTVSRRCTHQAPNISQVTGADKPYGRDCRALFGAPERFSLVGCDMAGIQLRALGHYMSPWDGGAYIKVILEGKKENGTDIHAVNQKAAGFKTRDNAKTFIYAFLLGAGDVKIGEIYELTPDESEALRSEPQWQRVKANLSKRMRETAPDDAVDKALKGSRIRDQFLRSLPAVKDLKQAIEDRVQERGHLLAVDGGQLYIRSKHAALAYLLQSFETVVFKRATKLGVDRITERFGPIGKDWWISATIHDEWQMPCRTEIADDIGKIMVQAIEDAGNELGSKCPLTGEYHVGKDWSGTH